MHQRSPNWHLDRKMGLNQMLSCPFIHERELNSELTVSLCNVNEDLIQLLLQHILLKSLNFEMN